MRLVFLFLSALCCAAANFDEQFTASAEVNRDGLRAWWRCDEQSGTTLADSAGSFTMATSGTVTRSATVAPVVFPNIRSFQWATSNGATMTAKPFTNPPFTIAFWVMRTNSSAGIVMSFLGTTGYWEGYYFSIGASALIVSRCVSNNNFIGGMDAPAGSLPTNGWTHVALSSSSFSNRIMYINGQPVATNTVYVRPGIHSDVTIGGERTNGGAIANASTAKMDDIRMYNRALSTAEIDAIYRGVR